jgi:hypothetical protein
MTCPQVSGVDQRRFEGGIRLLYWQQTPPLHTLAYMQEKVGRLGRGHIVSAGKGTVTVGRKRRNRRMGRKG